MWLNIAIVNTVGDSSSGLVVSNVAKCVETVRFVARRGVSPNVRCPVLIANARMLISAEMIQIHHTVHELTLMRDYCVYAVNGNLFLTLLLSLYHSGCVYT